MHVAGPGGHSHLAVLDVFYRPGMLAAVSPIVDQDTLLTQGAARSTTNERTPGRAARLLDEHGVGDGDIVLIVNAFGVNATVIEMGLGARQRGALVVGYSSLQCEAAIPDGHPSRFLGDTALSNVSDIHVDTRVPPGDVSSIGDAGLTVPLATAANSFALAWTLLDATSLLTSDISSAESWASSNAPGGDRVNRDLLDRYEARVRAL
ncbi:hypothetical protein Ssi02_57660 [Sinosporangium siamense]|uniref:SIS domain-containing protein n=1 Tax=Sinosporangium siamense TaxID=1367973 RepID=A0A919V7W1_9ACTN|nr:hypothetical protein Ssi02_57660 [Sinosporangium siamense]